jgi:hypothetical protein
MKLRNAAWAPLAAAIIGMDFAREPDRTAYWSPSRKPKTPDPKKRAKVKAARKQRRKQP